MCALDRSFKGSLVYPKRVIEPDTMDSEERAFYDLLVTTLEDSIEVKDLAVEQRNGDYRTVVYDDWNNDFLRYHFGDDGFWVSVRMYPGIMGDYEFSSLFYAQANKKQAHWRASIEPEGIAELKDPMVRSCKAFFGGADAKRAKKSEGTKSRLRMQVDNYVDRYPELEDFFGEDYDLLVSRDVILAGANFYPASEDLSNGDAVSCELEEDNPYDSEAVAVYDANYEMVGHLPKDGPAKKAVLKAIAEGIEVKGVVIDDGTDGGTRYKRKKIHVALVK